MFNGEKVYDNDNLRYYSLDQKFNPYWKLDTPYMKTPTSHLGIEYFPSNYYCKYYVSLGLASDETNNYKTNVSLYDYYISKSMNIIINQKKLDLTIHIDGDKEYFSDSDGILNTESYFDKSNGFINIVFNIKFKRIIQL